MQGDKVLCAHCGHDEHKHCAGNIQHATWKSERQQDGRAKEMSMCVSRHCGEPLCDCVDYIPSAKEN